MTRAFQIFAASSRMSCAAGISLHPLAFWPGHSSFVELPLVAPRWGGRSRADWIGTLSQKGLTAKDAVSPCALIGYLLLPFENAPLAAS
jgi:hypothetical protein